MVLTALALAAGCASDVSTPPQPTGAAEPSLPSPVPTDPAVAAESAVISAYRGMWSAYDQAGRPPQANPDDERLAQYAAGDALDVLTSGLTSMRDAGLVTEGEVVLSPEVVELSLEAPPAEARVEDCADTSGSARVRADGGPFDDEPGGRRLVIATLRDTGEGGWKVVDFAVREVGSCR